MVVLIGLLIIAVSMAGYRYVTAPHTAMPQIAYQQPAVEPRQPLLDWPSYGQSAVATPEDGVLATHGATAPQPTASTAKLITVLAVMEKKPFKLGGSGEKLTLGQSDVDLYNAYVAIGGSNVPVVNGETISQYQAMQGVLLASSDNLADSLAQWAFGSLSAYRSYATQMLARYGIRDTVIGDDASGLDPTTMSTAHDLAVIASRALGQPVIASITRQASAELPIVGTIHNTNALLEDKRVVGLKTGFTGEAGGVFILAATQAAEGHEHTIVTVVMGADVSRTAQQASYILYQSASRAFRYQTIIKQGEVVGLYHSAWQPAVKAVAAQEIGIFVWPTAPVKVSIQLGAISPQPAGGQIGRFTVARPGLIRQAPILLQQSLIEPSIWWRIMERPLK